MATGGKQVSLKSMIIVVAVLVIATACLYGMVEKRTESYKADCSTRGGEYAALGKAEICLQDGKILKVYK